MRDANGQTLRETLAVVEKQTGRKMQESINPVEFPDFLCDEWVWFLSLNGSRGSGMLANPITEQEIGWFFSNRGIKPHAWQVDLIRRLDTVAMSQDKGKQ